MIYTMKRAIVSLVFIVFGLGPNVSGQDTFSIVAMDPQTGEVGSAGATCLDDDDIAGGAIIISDVIPGLGAVNTQSFWIKSNQDKAHDLLANGMNAKMILELMVAGDTQNTPATRQYGAVTLSGNQGENTAAFTGDECFDVKKHVVGDYFAIQGNILLNEGVIDSMHARFLREDGPLHQRLMAAMQGANLPGADQRCLAEGVSSKSAFIRVAKMGDHPDSLWLDCNVSKTAYGVEPIDELQKKYNEFLLALNANDLDDVSVTTYPNPAINTITIEAENGSVDQYKVYDISGRLVKSSRIEYLPYDISIEDVNRHSVIIQLYKKNHLKHVAKHALIR